MNLSSHQVTEDEHRVLARGLNFAPAPKCIPKHELIAGTEAALRYLPDKTAAESARAAIANIIRRARPPTSNITANERRALSGLKRKETITIAKAAKGNAVVLFETKDYNRKSNRPFIQITVPTNQRRLDDVN